MNSLAYADDVEMYKFYFNGHKMPALNRCDEFKYLGVMSWAQGRVKYNTRVELGDNR